MNSYNLCIIKPNESAFSETFIEEHINRLAGNKKILYGGAFPLYDEQGKFLIRSVVGLISYLFQKRIFKKKEIEVRTRALTDYLIREKIDVVLAEYGMVGALVAKACKAAGVPLVIHFHGADAHHHKTVSEYKDLYRSAFEYANAIVAVSKDMIDVLIGMGANENKIHFVPCGVDINKFSPISINVSEKNFLSIGRFVEKKSPLSIIKALKKVTSVCPDARLWMVGTGPLLKKAEELAHHMQLDERICFTGALTQAEIYNLMKKMMCYVQHSVKAGNGDMEGTPVTVLEAASVTLPVIATRHAGIKQAVIDGESGFLVDEHDIEEMASKMIQIVGLTSDQLREMGQKGRQHIIKNYNINSQIAKLDQIIQKAIRDYNA